MNYQKDTLSQAIKKTKIKKVSKIINWSALFKVWKANPVFKDFVLTNFFHDEDVKKLIVKNKKLSYSELTFSAMTDYAQNFFQDNYLQVEDFLRNSKENTMAFVNGTLRFLKRNSLREINFHSNASLQMDLSRLQNNFEKLIDSPQYEHFKSFYDIDHINLGNALAWLNIYGEVFVQNLEKTKLILIFNDPYNKTSNYLNLEINLFIYIMFYYLHHQKGAVYPKSTFHTIDFTYFANTNSRLNFDELAFHRQEINDLFFPDILFVTNFSVFLSFFEKDANYMRQFNHEWNNLINQRALKKKLTLIHFSNFNEWGYQKARQDIKIKHLTTYKRIYKSSHPNYNIIKNYLDDKTIMPKNWSEMQIILKDIAQKYYQTKKTADQNLLVQNHHLYETVEYFTNFFNILATQLTNSNKICDTPPLFLF